MSLLVAHSANAGTLSYSSAMTAVGYYPLGTSCENVRRDNLIGSINVRGMTERCAYTSSTNANSQPHFVHLFTVDSAGGSSSPLHYVVLTAQSSAQPHGCFILDKYAAPDGAQVERLAFGDSTTSFYNSSISSTTAFYGATSVSSPQASLVYYNVSGSAITCSGTNCSNALVFMQLRRISCANLCSMATTLRPDCCPSSCNDNTSDFNVVGTWLTTE
ncbi:MAG: hypothetical protein QXS54_00360 [Candidatus Methanomethylicaceae archaeon]